MTVPIKLAVAAAVAMAVVSSAQAEIRIGMNSRNDRANRIGGDTLLEGLFTFTRNRGGTIGQIHYV